MASHDRCKIVLGQREEERDRVELRHDDEARRVGRVHDVAGVDEADAGHAVDG